MPIKYHNAKDENGNIVNIVSAVRGKDYVCLGCGNTLRAKLGNGAGSLIFFICTTLSAAMRLISMNTPRNT